MPNDVLLHLAPKLGAEKVKESNSQHGSSIFLHGGCVCCPYPDSTTIGSFITIATTGMDAGYDLILDHWSIPLSAKA